jgi:hypothetical protein
MSDTPAPTLEERVAALEEALPHITPARPWTDDQVAEWQAEFDKLMASSGNHEIKILPPSPVLTPETARALLAECVTVVQPGEVLAVRCPDIWTAQQVDEINRYDAARTEGLGISVLFVPGEEFAAVQPDPDDRQFRAKLDKHLPAAWNRLQVLLRPGGVRKELRQ